MDLLTTSRKMSRTEVGLSRMSGSRTNEGLKGSDVGTRAQDEEDGQPVPTTSYQELRRRRFFERTARLDRPVLHRRHAAASVPRSSITAMVENVVDVAGADGDTETLPPAIPSPSPPDPLTVPAVPVFPSLSNPTVPNVPSYPFHTPSSQSVLSSPPASPMASDAFFTPTAHPTASPSPETLPSHRPSDSSGSSNSSDTATPTTPTTAASTANVPYSNTTLTTSTVSNLTASTHLISSSQTVAFSTRTSSSFPQPTSGHAGSAGSAGSGAAGAAATLTVTSTAPVSIATSGSASDPGTSSGAPIGPNTRQVVGGVVGGIAGLALVLLVILFFLRRYRRQLQHRGELLETDRSERDPNTMSMRSSHTPLVAAVTAPFKKMRPASSQTTATAETGTSDRAFQRVAGRKIQPVLTSGGDGYGGNYGAFEKQAGLDKEAGAPSSLPEAQPLAGVSFYRDGTDLDGGHGSGTSTPTGAHTRFASDYRDFADPLDDEENRDFGSDVIAVMRPSPARSPVTTSAGPSPLAPQRSGPTMSSDAPPTPTVPPRFMADGVGRSLVSQDGSRGSRFTESV